MLPFCVQYAGVKIGPVVKKDVMRASVMLEHDEKYAVILAFDVRVERDAEEMANSVGVKIFQADIIYHLFDRFTAHLEELKRQKREEFKHQAVFPCKLRVMPNNVFNSRDPIVAGVVVEAGVVRQGTPLCVPSKDVSSAEWRSGVRTCLTSHISTVTSSSLFYLSQFLEIGICTSIESNHKEVETARKGEEVCIKVEPIPGESPKMFGRHFDEKDLLVSKVCSHLFMLVQRASLSRELRALLTFLCCFQISRTTIDVCKQYFRDDLQKSDWQLMVELKKIFQIL
jgi:translation initiation factor 5B